MKRRSLRSVNFELAQEFLDDGGDGAAVGETGEDCKTAKRLQVLQGT